MTRIFQVEDLTEEPVVTKIKRSDKPLYFCSCQDPKHNVLKLTEVDSEGICLKCEHYAVATRNPNGICYDGSSFGKKVEKLDKSDDSKLVQMKKKEKPPVVEKKKVITPKKEPKPKPVNDQRIYCKENRTVYKSIEDAAKRLGLERAAVARCVNGTFNHTKGYSFRRVGWRD